MLARSLGNGSLIKLAGKGDVFQSALVSNALAVESCKELCRTFYYNIIGSKIVRPVIWHHL